MENGERVISKFWMVYFPKLRLSFPVLGEPSEEAIEAIKVNAKDAPRFGRVEEESE